PYYATNAFETDPAHKVIKFVNLPSAAVIRIYTTSGILVRVIEHRSVQNGGEEEWDVRNRDGRLAASGVYFYHIEAGDRRRVGRMTIVTAGR
ncbi:MAG: T9SS type A sorting domain-containing protein, partial [Gemmatimonadetes bacterium]|nr:T9SS type A sorting domain-containing protein [Gemmatimonadota bacterium]